MPKIYFQESCILLFLIIFFNIPYVGKIYKNIVISTYFIVCSSNYLEDDVEGEDGPGEGEDI